MDSLRRCIVLLDKPLGPTSLECAEKLRRIFSAKKAGHSGTLDPGATGVLIIALDEATKAMPLLMGLPKEYEGVMHIHRDFSRDELLKSVKSLTGRIVQRPPVKSAVSRKPRERNIYSFEITGISGRDVSFRIGCQAGTYIRKLCSDLGERMDTQAHMKSLRRTKAGPFSSEECGSFEQLEKNPKKYVISIENTMERICLKKIFVKENSAPKILNGSPVLVDFIEKADKGIRKEERIGVYSGGKIIALATVKEDVSRGVKGSVARTDRVFRI